MRTGGGNTGVSGGKTSDLSHGARTWRSKSHWLEEIATPTATSRKDVSCRRGRNQGLVTAAPLADYQRQLRADGSTWWGLGSAVTAEMIPNCYYSSIYALFYRKPVSTRSSPGSGATAVVQSALCLTRKEKVAVKRIDLEQHSSSIEELQVLWTLTLERHKTVPYSSPFWWLSRRKRSRWWVIAIIPMLRVTTHPSLSRMSSGWWWSSCQVCSSRNKPLITYRQRGCVMSFKRLGSLLDIIKSARKRATKGGVLEETFIATVLKEVLQGLEYFHTSGQIHR